MPSPSPFPPTHSRRESNRRSVANFSPEIPLSLSSLQYFFSPPQFLFSKNKTSNPNSFTYFLPFLTAAFRSVSALLPFSFFSELRGWRIGRHGICIVCSFSLGRVCLFFLGGGGGVFFFFFFSPPRTVPSPEPIPLALAVSYSSPLSHFWRRRKRPDLFASLYFIPPPGRYRYGFTLSSMTLLSSLPFNLSTLSVSAPGACIPFLRTIGSFFFAARHGEEGWLQPPPLFFFTVHYRN